MPSRSETIQERTPRFELNSRDPKSVLRELVMANPTIRYTKSAMPFVLHAMDSVTTIASLSVLQWLAGQTVHESSLTVGLVACVGLFLSGEFFGIYRPSRGRSADIEVGLIAVSWISTFFVLLVLGMLTRTTETFPRSTILYWFAGGGLILTCTHMMVRGLLESLSKFGVGTRRTAIVGLNKLGLQIASNALTSKDCGMTVVGFFDDRAVARNVDVTNMSPPFMGQTSDLLSAIGKGEIDTVLVTLPMRAEKRIQSLLDQLANSTVSVYIVPDFFVFELLHSRWMHVGGLPVVSVFESPIYGVDGWLKRGLDLALSVFGLVMVSPLMIACALLVKLSSPGPIFFLQKRYGLDGKEILVWKFRSMRACDNGPVVKQATKGDPRVTPIGRILRRTSLDELPQLFNVIGGSMSLVGPRPHASAHNEQYRSLIRGYMMRHKVKPGITGLAQVLGSRGETDTLEKMEARIQLDHRYIREWSLWMDLKIILKTFYVVLKHEAY